ncbi:MAG: glycoside hydrolase family 65 protein [Clostridia bacterium]|nr:glycoside hydrolase family 65 protein [Clostridia bacterium]
MIYNLESKFGKNWIVAEDNVTEHQALPAKYESIFCQGNGYVCIRAAAEEWSSGDPGRCTIIAGTFDIAEDDACNTLVNLPDTMHLFLQVNGEDVDCRKAEAGSYLRFLNLKNGLLARSFDFSAEGRPFRAEFRRMVSLSDRNLAVSETRVSAKDGGAFTLSLTGGIDGQSPIMMEHLASGPCTVSDGVMQVVTYTRQSEIRIAVSERIRLELERGGERKPISPEESFDFSSGKNSVGYRTSVEVPEECSLIVTKYVVFQTSRDRGNELFGATELLRSGKERVLAASRLPLTSHLQESEREWERRIWSERDAVIDGNDLDQLALRFAVYHMTVMSPVHDNRMNIGAKGLSGPGYYGHAFWDTEIYLLPYFIFEAPEEARSLVEYRVNSLPAVRRNARKGGNRGARFCWESAWITDGEATPVWCDTGDLEIHITADVALGAYYYYIASGDEEFMNRGGYELIFDTATYWVTRMKENPATGLCDILDVTGPNEYHTHVNNNAYTNYLAHNNLVSALKYAEQLKNRNPALYEALKDHLNIDAWKSAAERIFLPKPNENGIIPEHDGYLALPVIVAEQETSASKNPEARKRADEYGINKCQCSKQADIVSLLYLMEDQFDAETKRRNFYFYEHNCFHHSSLSLNTHSCLAADLGERDMAYSLFERAAMIDMGTDPGSSSAGIHSASLGGIWQCVVLGFGGVRRVGEELRIEPNLPDAWNELTFRISWKGQRLLIRENHSSFTVENITNGEKKEISFLHKGKTVTVLDKVEVKLS